MGHVEEGIKELISEQFGSVPKLAEAIDLPAQTIYSALRNGIAGASATTVMPIAAALRIDPFELTRGNLAILPDEAAGTVEVPLFGSIVAGQPSEPDAADAMLPVPAELVRKYPRAFLLRVEGESMNRVLPNGCYALVDPCDSISASNRIYAVAVGEDRATVKRVKVLSNGYELFPDSTDSTFRSTVLDFGDIDADTVSVIGEVVWYCLPTDWRFSSR